MAISIHYLMWSMYEPHNVKIDITPNLIIFYKTMRRSKEHSRDYSSEWIELLIILFILTILGIAMYFSFRYDPNHTSTISNSNQNKSTLVASETSQSKSSSTAIKSAIQTQKTSQMIPIVLSGTPVKTVFVKATVVQSDASKVMQSRLVQLTPVKDSKRPSKNRTWSSKNVKLTRVRVPRPIRRIPEAK